MKANLYGTWYTIVQRPHHLAKVLSDIGFDVGVYTMRKMRNKKPLIDAKVNVTKNTFLPGPLRKLPYISKIADRYDMMKEDKVFDMFRYTEAELFINYQRPDRKMSSVSDLPGPLIYDCVDDFEGFEKIKNQKMRKWEEEFCERADHIWVVSRHLEHKFRKWGNKISYVPNGVDYEHFAYAKKIKISKLENDFIINPPRLIYVGAIFSWFNARLVGEIAKILKDWEIVLVGPCALDIEQKKWLSQDNISFLGKRDYSELPVLLAHADVAMIPFTINKLINSTNPIKLYEYLAAGLPVVATPMPEVLPYVEDGVVGCAESPQAFSQLVEAMNEISRPDRCQEIAQQCSWESRFTPVLKSLQLI